MTALAAPEHTPMTREFAVAAVAAAALVFSLNGLLVRQLESADAWQIVFWRGLGLLLGISLVFLWRHRRHAIQRIRAVGRLALLAGPLQGVGTTLFVIALTHTTVANAMMMLSATPLFAAVIGWAFLGEKVGWATAAAIGATVAGVALMTVDGIQTGSMIGNMAALGNAVTFAAFLAFLRRAKGADMVPAVMVGSVLAVSSGAIFATDLAPPLHDILICLVWGIVVQSIGMSLMMVGARGLPAAEISLVAMIEFVVAPVWAWLAVGELPSAMSSVGGGIIFAAMIAWSVRRARLNRPVPVRTAGV